MTSASKDDVIAEKIFDLFSNMGYSSKKSLIGRGEGDYHYRRFEPPQEGKAVEVRVSRKVAPSSQSGDVRSTIGNISKALGPQRVKIEFAIVEKEGGFMGVGKSAKKYEFSINADDYIDHDLKVKDEAAFQTVLSGYLKTIGLHE